MSNILDSLQKIQSKFEEIKPKFESYIKNKEIPLEERWAVFVIAEASLKKHDYCGPSFSSLDSDFIMYDGPIHMDRGHHKKTTDMIESLEEMKEEIKNGTFWRQDWIKKMVENVDLNALKEEILEQNCGSFEYDW